MNTNQTTQVAEIDVVVGELPRRWDGKVIRFTSGVISIRDLIPRTEVAFRRHSTSSGYQREPSNTRVRKLANAIARQRVDLPTALLLNLRDFDPDSDLVAANGRGRPHRAILRLTDQTLWCVDGQHRIGALRQLFQESPDTWGSYVIPFVCTLGGSEEFELEQFYIVNSNAKSVPTNLAYELLTHRASIRPGIMEALEEENKGWVAHGKELADEMGRHSQIWTNRIRFPNDPKLETIIQLGGMVNSLKVVLSSPYFMRLTNPSRLAILEAYWEGIRRCIPKAFQRPQDYTVQKSLGVTVFHTILPDILEVVRDRNASTADPEAYHDILADPLDQLNAENAAGDIVFGDEFWKTAPDGAAGGFSSSAGRRVLTSRLKRALPPIQVV